jgi:recombinational DNA repair protein (RecF pathway)
MKKYVVTALVLHKSELAGGHRRLAVLSRELGFFYTVAFGASLSRGRRGGATSPYCLAELFLTENGAGGYRLDDIRGLEFFTAVNENLTAFYQAAFYTEALIVSEAGGQDSRFFDLYLFLLSQLEKGRCRETTYTFLLFFMYYNGILPPENMSPAVMEHIEAARFEAASELAVSDQGLNLLLRLFKKNFSPVLKSLPLAEMIL